MSVIKPRTRGKELIRHITRLDRENYEALFAYAQFLGEPTDYVVNQLVETVLARDKEYLAWRAQHTESFAPPKPDAARRRSSGAAVASRTPHAAPKLEPAPTSIAR